MQCFRGVSRRAPPMHFWHPRLLRRRQFDAAGVQTESTHHRRLLDARSPSCASRYLQSSLKPEEWRPIHRDGPHESLSNEMKGSTVGHGRAMKAKNAILDITCAAAGVGVAIWLVVAHQDRLRLREEN